MVTCIVVAALMAAGPAAAQDPGAADELLKKFMTKLDQRLAELREELLEEIQRELDKKLPKQVTPLEPVEEESEPANDSEIWLFLVQKYDRNGDGKVSREEYERGDERFARLDENQDGILASEDFPRGGGRMGMRRQMRGMYMDSSRMAPRILHRYFQEDEEGGEEDLSRESLKAALKAYDRNHDEKLDREEFQAEVKKRGARPISGVPDYDRYAHLVEEIDESGDEILSFQEIHSYFDRKNSDGDEWLSSQEVGRGGGGRGGERGRRGGGGPRPGGEGPATGERAPDFTLGSTSESREKVTLSSFQGLKPVALIFGSYT